MVWLPAAYDRISCNGDSSNQSTALTLICFILQYFSKSNDEILGKIYGDKNSNEHDYDFIVIGAGAAGCVVANRLSEESNWKVLLLEAGDEEPFATAIPGLRHLLFKSNIDYAYRIEGMKQVYNRGKVMGGSTSINGMLYMRGSKVDYDDWDVNGNEGWSWDDVLPYFKKSENARDPEILAKYAEYHGTGGPLTVEQFPTLDKNVPLFINAYEEVGLKETDLNKGDQIGVGRKQFTNVHGARLSANGAFIRPIRGKRSNLVVRPNSRATKIIIDPTTKRATGVQYETSNGEVVTVSANKEIIVSAGAIDSPKLLMLSGIGPRDHLEELNIPVIQDLSVGYNLREHALSFLKLTTDNSALITSDETLNAELFEWMNTHEGNQALLPSISVDAFYQTKFENQSGAADIQFSLLGLTQRDNTLGNISITVALVKPKSVGTVKLDSNNPVKYQPIITLNLLSEIEDVEVLLEGFKFARKVANTKSLKNAGLRESKVPIAQCKHIDINSDDYLRCYFKNTVRAYWHALGTCKMGPNTDKNAVVDSTLKVHGINGLRVIDASIMPDIIRGNTMAPVYMIGEKGSDMIKKKYL